LSAICRKQVSTDVPLSIIITDTFFAGLHHFLADRAIDARPKFNFDDVGEVKFLRRRLEMARRKRIREVGL
jgi:hypothetical protein